MPQVGIEEKCLFGEYFLLTNLLNIEPLSGVTPGIFRRGADSSDEGAKIWFSGYYKCQNLRKITFHLPTGG